jgi:hypothetical protein
MDMVQRTVMLSMHATHQWTLEEEQWFYMTLLLCIQQPDADSIGHVLQAACRRVMVVTGIIFKIHRHTSLNNYLPDHSPPPHHSPESQCGVH